MGQQRYVVAGAYVTVKTMTMEGPRIVGLFAGAPWPADAPLDATQHHLSQRLIVPVEDPSAVNPTLTPMDVAAGRVAADVVEEQEKTLNQHRGAQKAAETRAANAKAEADAAAAAAKAKPVTESK